MSSLSISAFVFSKLQAAKQQGISFTPVRGKSMIAPLVVWRQKLDDLKVVQIYIHKILCDVTYIYALGCQSRNGAAATAQCNSS